MILLGLTVAPGWSHPSEDWAGTELKSNTRVLVDRPHCLSVQSTLRIQYLDLGETRTAILMGIQSEKASATVPPRLFLDISVLDTNELETLVMPQSMAPPRCTD